MRGLREHISEAQQWVDSPVPGDDFAINIREECLLESHVVEVTADAVVIAADDRMINMLESYGMLEEDTTLEQIRRYGAVGSNRAQGFTVAEGDIDPNRHPQTRDYGRGDDTDKVKRSPQTRLDDPWDAVSDKPDSVGRDPRMKDPGKYDDPWQYVQDSEQDFRRVMELAGVAETEANTTDPLADKAAALAPVGADGEQEPVATVDKTMFPGAPDVKMPGRQTTAQATYSQLHRDLRKLADTGAIKTPQGKTRAGAIIDAIQTLVDTQLKGNPVPSKQIWLSEQNQSLSRIRELAGMAEGSSDIDASGEKTVYVKDCKWLKVVEWLEKNVGPATLTPPNYIHGWHGRGWALFFNPGVKELQVRARTELSPEELKAEIERFCQGLAEGLSDIDMDLQHIAKTQGLEHLVDAMRGEFGIETQQYLQDMMDRVENKLDRRGMRSVDMETKLRMLMDRVQEIYAGQDISEAEYQGRDVPLGKPMQGDVAKFKVYVKDPKTGNVKKVNFGDKTMRIKKSNPARRKSFRARHNCANPGPRTKARYWACRSW